MKSIIYSVLFVIYCLSSTSILIAQHDNSRDAVRHIASGKLNQVEKTLAGKKPYGGEAEKVFVEMLALLKQNEIKAAFDKATEAANLGLPFERLLVGPRERALKTARPATLSNLEKSNNARRKLIHGPIGRKCDRDVCVVLGANGDGEAKVRLIVGGGTAIADEQDDSSNETDFTTQCLL